MHVSSHVSTCVRASSIWRLWWEMWTRRSRTLEARDTWTLIPGKDCTLLRVRELDLPPKKGRDSISVICRNRQRHVRRSNRNDTFSEGYRSIGLSLEIGLIQIYQISPRFSRDPASFLLRFYRRPVDGRSITAGSLPEDPRPDPEEPELSVMKFLRRRGTRRNKHKKSNPSGREYPR